MKAIKTEQVPYKNAARKDDIPVLTFVGDAIILLLFTDAMLSISWD